MRLAGSYCLCHKTHNEGLNARRLLSCNAFTALFKSNKQFYMAQDYPKNHGYPIYGKS